MSTYEKLEEEVLRLFEGLEGSHDKWHILRVVGLAERIAKEEGADVERAKLIALFHEVGDEKVNALSKEKALALLKAHGVEGAEEIVEEASRISWRKGEKPKTKEGLIAEDADRLDAIGAIGIGRAFAYGGRKGRPLYDPSAPMDRGESTIHHFFQKLVKIKENLNTASAKRLAERRHAFLLSFVEEFLEEWYFALRRRSTRRER